MIISPAMLLAATGKNDKEKTTKMNRATVRDKIKSTLNNSLAHWYDTNMLWKSSVQFHPMRFFQSISWSKWKSTTNKMVLVEVDNLSEGVKSIVTKPQTTTGVQ